MHFPLLFGQPPPLVFWHAQRPITVDEPGQEEGCNGMLCTNGVHALECSKWMCAGSMAGIFDVNAAEADEPQAGVHVPWRSLALSLCLLLITAHSSETGVPYGQELFCYLLTERPL